LSDRLTARLQGVLRFRGPSEGWARRWLLICVNWIVLYAAVELSWFHCRLAIRPWLFGATVLLLVAEAWISTRRRWRTHLLRTIAFAIPTYNLLTLFETVLGSCCFCDQSLGARAWRITDAIGDSAYSNAAATLPAFALLAILWRRAPAPAESRAHTLATISGLLAALSVFVVLAAMICALDASFLREL
jgi:hypothetical protein